jgi:hypothetical protein
MEIDSAILEFLHVDGRRTDIAKLLGQFLQILVANGLERN